MRVTSKGQVTIPRHVRESLGIAPRTEIDFIEENGRFYLACLTRSERPKKFRTYRGIMDSKLTTEEIMKLTRDI